MRSVSLADVARQGKRLSLQFPIQPTSVNSPTFPPRGRPQSWVAAAPPSAATPDTPSFPDTNLLAIVAAQERFVLELKEELLKAEKDLDTLKKHYAAQEAAKQRNELRRTPQAPSRSATLDPQTAADRDDQPGSILWMQREMERRKGLINATKTSQRKVFTNSRHLRTLSLLSPDKTYTPSFPQPSDVRDDLPTPSAPRPPLAVARTSTAPHLGAPRAGNAFYGDRYEPLAGLPGIQREALLRTGKQMATDFKDGLMTFIEDIRQATVGEEAVNTAALSALAAGRRKPFDGRASAQRASIAKRSPGPQTDDINHDFWKEHGLSESAMTPANKRTRSLPAQDQSADQAHPPAAHDDFDEWATWGTPNDQRTPAKDTDGDSSGESDASSSVVSSAPASSRASTTYHMHRHDSKASLLTASSSASLSDEVSLRASQSQQPVPWPDLVKLSPTHIKRTASHLMKEWEKTLTPSPEARDGSHPSGDYLGRAVSPGTLA